MMGSPLSGQLASIAGAAAAITSGAVAAGPVYFQDGSQAAPGIAYAAAHGTGLWRTSGGNLGLVLGGTLALLVTTTFIQLASAGKLQGFVGGFSILDSSGNDATLTFKERVSDVANGGFTFGAQSSANVVTNTTATGTSTVTCISGTTGNMGTMYTFVQDNDSFTLVVKPHSGDTIRLTPALVTTSGGALTFAAGKGSSITIILIAANRWQVVASAGTLPVPS